MSVTRTYGQAIRDGFAWLLREHSEVIVMGQGVWSPWYVGSSMTDLDKEFGRERIIDTPVSEWATTSAAVGASLNGMKPIVIHPRMDFLVLASDSIANQASKWNHMLGGQASPSICIRGIINRGGEQGAQHSQALHSWYAHLPGIKVVMPSNVRDARDLLIAATLSPDPVLYIDDKWLYQLRDDLPPPEAVDLNDIQNIVVRGGVDLTICASSYSTWLALEVAKKLETEGVSVEVVDQRIINPNDSMALINSVKKTGLLLVIDGSWANCGLSAEMIASVVENIPPTALKSSPKRITLPAAPAPTAANLEADYYPSVDKIAATARTLLKSGQSI